MVGSSTPKKFVSLFLTFVLNTTRMELALNVIMDLTLKMEDVPSLNPTMPSQVTSDVEPGTGIIKYVFNAQATGFSTKTKSVSQLVISAKNKTMLENAPLATRVMILPMESVSFHHQIMLSLLISDVPLGTGITKFVFNALTTGFSMLTKNVSLFLTNAKVTTKMDHALHAIMATILLKENASSPNPTMLNQVTSVAELGTGTIKSV